MSYKLLSVPVTPMQQCLAVNAWSMLAVGCLMPLIVLHRMELATRERLKLAQLEQQREGEEEQREGEEEQQQQQQQVSAALALGSSHEQHMQAWSVGELLIQFFACSCLVWYAVCALLLLLLPAAHLADACPP